MSIDNELTDAQATGASVTPAPHLPACGTGNTGQAPGTTGEGGPVGLSGAEFRAAGARARAAIAKAERNRRGHRPASDQAGYAPGQNRRGGAA